MEQFQVSKGFQFIISEEDRIVLTIRTFNYRTETMVKPSTGNLSYMLELIKKRLKTTTTLVTNRQF